ncbi:MAG: hypothetical protein D6741_04980, partial [Planctomycetota bacterium]
MHVDHDRPTRGLQADLIELTSARAPDQSGRMHRSCGRRFAESACVCIKRGVSQQQEFNVSRNTYRLLGCLFLVLTAVSGNTRVAGAAEKPNIVFILADDLGIRDLSNE